LTSQLLPFIDASPTPYHAVRQGKLLLGKAGFKQLQEADPWQLEPGGAYFVVRGGKTLIAWRQGSEPVSEHGFRIIAAHSDSPALKLRPDPILTGRGAGYLATEIYGSPLLYTWLDRDLFIAGNVYYETKSGALSSKLIELREMRVRAISLAPHLRVEKSDDLKIDRNKDFPVVVTTDPGAAGEALLDAIRTEIPDQKTIRMLDGFLADAAPCALIGSERRFVSGPRLDNLFCSFATLSALAQCPPSSRHTSLASIFDAEEIGSAVWTGARSNALDTVLSRIALASDHDRAALERSKARSIILSADMAHAEHPSFPDATEPSHAPHLNKGIALKFGARGNYAIGPRATAWFRHICDLAGAPTQNFMYRCDHGGGSSVGPLITTNIGIEGVDVGAPMLAMHSVRELAGVDDLATLVKAFENTYTNNEALLLE
jgi:aspartyl aminopeptidase